MGKFNLPLQTPEHAYNALLGSENQVEEISLSLLDEVDNQPFPINEEKIEQIADSILSVGLLEPVLVRRIGERYEILSGRHRYRACKQLGRDKIKCIVMNNLDDNKARYVLITTNTERNNDYAPSVYAKAYAEEVEILKKLGHNNPTVAAVAERHGVNRKQIQRYLRLNSLIPEFLNLVDNQSIPFMVGVELSLFSSESQKILFDFIKSNDEIKITVNVAKELRSFGELSNDVLTNFFYPIPLEKIEDKSETKETKPKETSKKKPKTEIDEKTNEDPLVLGEPIEIEEQSSSKMPKEISGMFTKFSAQEMNFQTHGYTFDCHFGTHLNGGWLAIINFGIACELTTDDIGYNIERIHTALSSYQNGTYFSETELAEIPVALAKAIIEKLVTTD